jgi:hypothetical protein
MRNSPEGKNGPISANGCTNTVSKSHFSRRIFHLRKAQIIDLDGYGHHQKPSYGNGLTGFG